MIKAEAVAPAFCRFKLFAAIRFLPTIFIKVFV